MTDSESQQVMATNLAAGPVHHHTTPGFELVIRAMREFDEMPTLRITLEQGMRLLSLDRDTCLGVFGILERARLLERDPSGRYVRVPLS